MSTEDIRQFLIERVDLCCSRVPLIMLGSGFSLDYGLPSMHDLGMQVIDQLRRARHVDPNLIDEFARETETSGFEAAVDKVAALSEHLPLIVQSIHTVISSGDQTAYENLVLVNRPTPFYELLEKFKSTSHRPLAVVSTNYDRVVEYECGRSNIPLFSGFSQSYLGRYDDQNRPAARQKFSVDLYKVHGSVDWYVNNDTYDAAFLPLTRSAAPPYSPLIVIPGHSKYLASEQGVPRLVKNAADEKLAQSADTLAIGYGFRDPHIHEMLLQRFRNKTLQSQIIVLAHTLSDEAKSAARQCDRYLLIERAGDDSSRVYSESHGGEELQGTYWNAHGLMELYR